MKYITHKLHSSILLVESQRAHWLRRARKLGSPLLAAGLASIKIKNSKLGSKIPRSLLQESSISLSKLLHYYN